MSGGYRNYLKKIIPRMALHSDIESLLCISPSTLHVKKWFQPIPNVEFINCQPYRVVCYGEYPNIKKALERFSPDLIFIPMERYLSFGKTPVVNMIQNMEPFTKGVHGNPFTEKLRHGLQSNVAKRSLRKADRVIAVSGFVRDFLINHWSIPEDKISLVYHGSDPVENKEGIRPSFIPKDWDGQFLFTAGSIRPARGLEDLLGAMKLLLPKTSEIKGLVIAGDCASNMIGYQRKLKSLIEAQGLSSKICWAGSLPENEMTWCYQNCRFFVMTSRVESFGIIAVEAMAHGCICIAADNPCLPEIFEDAAIYYPAKNWETLSEVITKVFCIDGQKRELMAEKAKKRAAQFSWDVCAETTISELKKTIETFNKNLTR